MLERRDLVLPLNWHLIMVMTNRGAAEVVEDVSGAPDKEWTEWKIEWGGADCRGRGRAHEVRESLG